MSVYRFVTYEEYAKEFDCEEMLEDTNDPCPSCVHYKDRSECEWIKSCKGGLYVDVSEKHSVVNKIEAYPYCKDDCVVYSRRGYCSGCKRYEDYESDPLTDEPQEIPQDSAWQPEEVDLKKPDITKATPGQMFKDFHYALLSVSEVTRYGSEKYGKPGSWKASADDTMRYKDALNRHLLQGFSEQEYDTESGYHHLVHAAWNILAILQFMVESGKEIRNLKAITKPFIQQTKTVPKWLP